MHIVGGDEAWDTYAEGYKLAGDKLVDAVITERGWQIDFMVYPIVFLYCHYLELRLKELSLKVGIKVLGTHKLLPLWKALRPRLEAVWNDPESQAFNALIEARLSELDVVDSSESFRYPKLKGGQSTLAGLREINVERLKNVIQAVSNVLDGSSIGLYEMRKAENEAAAEYEHEQHGSVEW